MAIKKVSNQVIKEEAWSSWTPSFVNLSGGTLNYAKYIQIGKTVHFRMKYTLGGAGVGTGVTMTLPVNLHSDYGTAVYVANGFGTPNGATKLLMCRYSAADKIEILAVTDNTGYAGLAALGATVPGTWAVNNIINIVGTYEAA